MIKHDAMIQRAKSIIEELVREKKFATLIKDYEKSSLSELIQLGNMSEIEISDAVSEERDSPAVEALTIAYSHIDRFGRTGKWPEIMPSNEAHHKGELFLNICNSLTHTLIEKLHEEFPEKKTEIGRRL